MMRWAFAILLVLVGLAAPASADRLKVIASFSVIADMAREVGGNDIDLTILVGPDSDAHVFQANAEHARAVSTAKVFLANGRGLDAWAQRLLKATGSRAMLVTLSDRIASRPGDPHAWNDARNAVIYVEAIRKVFAAASPAFTDAFNRRAANYTQRLRELDASIRQGFARVPPDGRKVITTHDAFGFFAEAYGLQFLAPIGLSTENQPSAKAVATLITQIRREKIRALFLENISDSRLITQIARETRVRIGGKLYSDALSPPAGPAGSYIELMRHNARLLTEAMAGGS
jgi:zinc/manganese transport system substrate-binding protein